MHYVQRNSQNCSATPTPFPVSTSLTFLIDDGPPAVSVNYQPLLRNDGSNLGKFITSDSMLNGVLAEPDIPWPLPACIQAICCHAMAVESSASALGPPPLTRKRAFDFLISLLMMNQAQMWGQAWSPSKSFSLSFSFFFSLTAESCLTALYRSILSSNSSLHDRLEVFVHASNVFIQEYAAGIETRYKIEEWTLPALPLGACIRVD